MIAADRYTPQALEFARLGADEARARSEEFLALMLRRRSVRHFSPDPVAPELIENALRTAATAPSGANQQPWTFVAVSDPAVKARIREAAEHEEELLYRRRASREYLEALEPIGTDWVKPHLTDAPCVIAVFEQPWSRDESGEKRKHYYVRESGGSATDAQDLVADFRAAPQGWSPRRAIDLTADGAILTALANDIGPDAVFARQVIAYGRPGDVAIAISTSGGSPNVVEALAEARRRGLATVALLRYDGGRVAAEGLADHVIVTRSEHIPRIQEAQASAYHVLRELVEGCGG